MIKFAIILGFCALVAHTATIKDVKLHRIVRSPHYGGYFHHDESFHSQGPPPPPPFLYHTHNWSGVGRGIDGAVKGVFSGAAAAAGSAVPAVNGAFSLAEAGATSSAGSEADCDDNAHSSGVKAGGQYKADFSQSHKFGSGSIDQGGQSNSNFGASSNGGTGFNSQFVKASASWSSQSNQDSVSKGQDSNGGYGGHTSGSSSGYGGHSGGYESFRKDNKESQFFGQNDKTNQFGSQGSVTGHGSFKGNEQSKFDTNFGASAQASAQSGSSAFGSGNSNDNYKTGSWKLQAGGKGAFESQKGRSIEHDTSSSSEESGENHAGHGGYHKNFNAHPSQLGQNIATNGFGHESNSGFGVQASESNSGYNKQSGGYGSYRKDYKVSHGAIQNSREDQFGAQQGQGGQGSFNANGQFDQTQESNSHGSIGASWNSANSAQTSAQSGSSDFGSSNGNHYNKGFGSSTIEAGGSGNFKSQQLKSTEEAKSGEESSLISGQAAGNNAGGQGASLNGALELASQGLKAASNAPCSTCQKSSYALSNAKSYNGNAIALAIGG